MKLIYLSGAWVLGIFIGAQVSLPLGLAIGGLLTLPLLYSRFRWRKAFVLGGLCLAVFFCGGWHYQSSQPEIGTGNIGYYNEQGTAAVKGTLYQPPEAQDTYNRLFLAAAEIMVDGQWQEVSGNVLVYAPLYADYSYGDYLLITGELETPPQFDSFDYQAYLARDGIYATIYFPRIETLDKGQGFAPLGWIYSLREDMAQGLANTLPEPAASLAQGIVLGVKDNIPESVREDFSLSGTAHLLAISGLHLGIVAGILVSLGLRLFGRRHYYYVWLALVFIWLYVVITGMQPPVVRAAIMASIFLAAELLGRQRSAFTALAFAAAIMVAANPQVLWSASFQMSFMAMAGLMFFFPPLRERGQSFITARLSETNKLTPMACFINDSLAVSLAAVIGVWPLVAYYFGIVSIASPLATLLALPALSMVIVLGAATALLALATPMLALITGLMTWVFLTYILAVAEGFANLPLSHFEVSQFSGWLTLAYFLLLAAVLWLWKRRPAASASYDNPPVGGRNGEKGQLKNIRFSRRWLLAALLIVAVPVSLLATALPDDKLHVSFLDVGQGDAILIQTPSNQDILIDGGPSPQALNLELSRQMPFWDRTIDLIILTHPQADHLNGLLDILERYTVKQVLYPEAEGGSDAYGEWLKLIEEKDIKATAAAVGQRIDAGGGVTIEVLNTLDSADANDSLVLALSYGETSFLLTGDIGQDIEMELIMSRLVSPITVLKVAHHGSATSTSDEFLAVTNPQFAIISVGAENTYDHPADEVILKLEEAEGLENVYRTDQFGTIEFITDGQKIWLKTARSP